MAGKAIFNKVLLEQSKNHPKLFIIRSSQRICSIKKVFLQILQNSQRVSFLIKLQALAYNFIKKGLWHRCFPVNFAKFLRALFHRTPRDCFCHSFLDPLIVDELILQHGRPMKGVKSYIPLGLLSKALTIANLPNAQAELRLC